jgi:ectoine hydroxylase-related dioxygenase (phytanoyl-CoA dioxygenase family)
MKPHIEHLLQKGYSVAENYLTADEVAVWQNKWNDIQKQAILEEYGVKQANKNNMPNYNIVYKEDNNYVWKSTGKISETTEGKMLIDKILNDLQTINPNIKFMYDKFINQKKDYQGHAPHQDNAVGKNEYHTDALYSAYVSLSDTDEESGCLWVEDTDPKRSDSLKYCDTGCVSGNTCFCQQMKLLPSDMKYWKGHNLIPLPLKKGDCVFFDGWVLHGTAANLGENIRQTMIFHCGVL